MNFYKVLHKDENGKLTSALSACAITYEKITHAPKGTYLFVFSDLYEAKNFASSTTNYVIYRVRVTNPKIPQKIISSFYLPEITREDIVSFWNGSWTPDEWETRTPISKTVICDSIELLEEIP